MKHLHSFSQDQEALKEKYIQKHGDAEWGNAMQGLSIMELDDFFIMLADALNKDLKLIPVWDEYSDDHLLEMVLGG